MNNFHEWLREKQAFVEALLEKKLPQISHEIPLNEAIRYSVLNGGKRMRSLLVLATAEIIETPLIAIENIICALEFAHAYSLVHDDMPCMDNDDLRRGKLSLFLINLIYIYHSVLFPSSYLYCIPLFL